jgi:nitroimidazol reductase NimA-like FMN-containing flavoprotein (pyridoxamine 5'-phosphate oxidase superfamily)
MKYEVKDLSAPEIDGFLKSQKVGLLCLGGEAPYAVPLAYTYDHNTVYLTMRPTGRKMDSIARNRNACFVVYWMPEDFGMTNMQWKSIICEGKLEQLTDRESVTRAVRAGEEKLGLPQGSWDRMIDSTMQNPSVSAFWKLEVKTVGGKCM